MPTPHRAPPRSPSAAAPAPRTIDEYIASSPAEVRPVLEAIRATVRKAAPTAEERISYRIPAFFLEGALVYFAAFKGHIGFYPPVRDAALRPLLERYAGPKGNLRFPLSEPVPLALVTQLVEARVRENRARRAAVDGDEASGAATSEEPGRASTRAARGRRPRGADVGKAPGGEEQ